MKKIVKVLNTALTVVMIAVLLFAGYVFVTVLRVDKGKVPSVFGFSFLQIATGSMEPTIPTGALIMVRQTDAAEIREGDVICFYSTDPMIAGMPNTHRVTQITTENGTIRFITKGDAADEEDPYPVYPDQLVGVFVRILPIQNLAQILHSPYFFFFALLVPLTAVIFVEVIHFKKSAEEKKEKANEKSE
ncbi:MAG: signal peptidase I [Clostridia bacterium]|nr:signal peptidase I [Clostridia bacterium]